MQTVLRFLTQRNPKQVLCNKGLRVQSFEDKLMVRIYVYILSEKTDFSVTGYFR